MTSQSAEDHYTPEQLQNGEGEIADYRTRCGWHNQISTFHTRVSWTQLSTNMLILSTSLLIDKSILDLTNMLILSTSLLIDKSILDLISMLILLTSSTT